MQASKQKQSLALRNTKCSDIIQSHYAIQFCKCIAKKTHLITVMTCRFVTTS